MTIASHAVRAEDCPSNPDALGTSRVLTIDPNEFPKLGAMAQAVALPLAEREVVLTFDDGPVPFIQRIFADSGYAGKKVTTATSIVVEIVRKNPDQVGFAVNPRRWVVERFFAWIGRNRRLAKDFEATINSARAFLYAKSVMLLVPRIARAS